MKKFTLILVITLFIYSCSKKDKDYTTIGIGIISNHQALTDLSNGIIDELKSSEYNFKFDIQNANGDINTAAAIANKFNSDVDIAIGIATPMAISLANTIKNKPIVFSAVNNPVEAGLIENFNIGYKNITGVSDTIPIKQHILEFLKIYPIKKLGFIYTSSESNSVGMAETTKKVCNELGIKFIPATITNSSEVKQATESIIGKVDAIYAVTDNTLFSGINSLTETAKRNKIPVFSAEFNSSKDSDILFSIGFDYYKLGILTGKIVLDIMNGKNPSEIPVVSMFDSNVTKTLINLDVAKNLSINIPENIVKNADIIIKDNKITSMEK